jgi:hypothetical protein
MEGWGSSPSERAQVTGPYLFRGGVFFVLLGAMTAQVNGFLPSQAVSLV